MFIQHRDPTAVIQGRTVNQRDAYRLVIPARNNSAFVEEDANAWKLVRSVSDAPGCRVFNLSVAEDESYIADGIAAHNCGYVGVPPGHPFHGQPYDDVDVEVHGDLTYAAPCADDEEGGICHVPRPGEPAEVYWLGFDCGHAFDLAPAMVARERRYEQEYGWPRLPEMTGEWATTYKTLAYVTAETERLAEQVAAHSAAASAGSQATS